MALVHRAESSEDYSWRCHACNTRASVRTRSFFANCVLIIEKLLCWCSTGSMNWKCIQVMLFEDITNWDTTVNFNNFFILECRNWLMNQHIQLGGFDANGQLKYVEVDESYFFHWKYHRGHRRCSTWVVGLLEHGTWRCWLEVVVRRNVCTVEQIISTHVLPGMVIVTNGWAGYDMWVLWTMAFISMFYAEHFVVDINPEINTQAIEGLWMQSNASCDIRAAQAVHCSQVIWLPFSGAIAIRHVFGKF